jgi:hypothetical protein
VTVDPAGTATYAAPRTVGTFHLVATLKADPSVTAAATITTVSVQLVDAGGPLLPDAHAYAIWWGPAGSFGDAIPAVESLLRNLDGAGWTARMDEYMRGTRASVAFAGHLFDTTPVPDLGPTSVAPVVDSVCRTIAASGRPPDPLGVYLVYARAPRSGAWHWYATCQGTTVAIALHFSDGQARFVCDGTLSGDASWWVGTTSHELAEAMTDPIPYGGWTDASRLEIADKCAYACARVGGAMFPVTALWSNAAAGCVGP